MTQIEQEHQDLIGVYCQGLRDRVDLLEKEMRQAIKVAGNHENLISLETQVRDQAEEIQTIKEDRDRHIEIVWQQRGQIQELGEKLKRLDNIARAAQNALAQSEDRAQKEKERADTNEMLLNVSNRSRIQWYPPTEVPPPGRYIVRHKDGATFFLEPIGGRWPKWVEKWMEIPE